MYTLEKEKSKLPYVLPGGKHVPSVTTVLNILFKHGLLNWAYSLGQKGIPMDAGKSYAIDVGNLVHYLIECFAKGTEPDIDPEYSERVRKKAWEIFGQFLEYLDSRKGKIADSELVLVDEDNEYGGTVDLLVNFPEEPPEFWDIKTSKEIYREHFIQIGAYGLLLEKCTNSPARLPRVVLLPKGGKLYAPDISAHTYQAAQQVWNDLLETYNSLRTLEKSIEI
jgi:hypothetical protein